MGTTRIKVIDLSSNQKEIKTSRKHAEKLAGVAKIKKAATTENTDKKSVDATTSAIVQTPEIADETSVTSVDTNSVPSVVTKKSLHHKSKKYQAAKKLIENKAYSAKEALSILPKTSITKFDPAVEVHINVVDKNVKAQVKFPYSAGKKKESRYLVFSDKQSTINDKQVIWGDEKTIAEIEGGKLKAGRDFDIVLASPKFMPTLAKIAKILGPKGLMPNPKKGTILDDPRKYLEGESDDISQFSVDPTTPVIHAKIGKLSQGEKELEENLRALILAIGPTKIQKAVLKSTMSPAINLDLASI